MSIDLLALSSGLVQLLNDLTGIKWIPEDQNAPRPTSRPYGTLSLVGPTLTGHSEERELVETIVDVVAVNQVGKAFALDGDVSDRFLPGSSFLVKGSTGNDQAWTIASVAVVAGDTQVTVEESIPDGTADGQATIGHRTVCKPGTVTMSLMVYGVDDPKRVYEPRQILLDLVGAIEAEEVVESLEALGASYRADFGVQPANVQLEQLIEVRAALDVVLGVTSQEIKNVSIMESVDIGETYLAPNGQVAYTDISTVTVAGG